MMKAQLMAVAVAETTLKQTCRALTVYTSAATTRAQRKYSRSSDPQGVSLSSVGALLERTKLNFAPGLLHTPSVLFFGLFRAMSSFASFSSRSSFLWHAEGRILFVKVMKGHESFISRLAKPVSTCCTQLYDAVTSDWLDERKPTTISVPRSLVGRSGNKTKLG
jgi:hypothetical protein